MIIRNNLILVSRELEPECYDAIRMTFRIYSEEDSKYLYLTEESGDYLVVPRGFLHYLPERFLRFDESISDIPTLQYSQEYWDDLAIMSSNVILRDDQIMAIQKMYYARRGIIQMATGSGKTEIMAGFFKLMKSQCGENVLASLILEPTLGLMTATVSRLRSYGIDAISYQDIRGEDISGKIVVTHPKSLVNDLENDPTLLNEVKIFISDEGHHLQAETWRKVSSSLIKVEYNIALSASVINPERVPVVDLTRLEYEELLVLGVTGPILLDIGPSYYINKGILSTPIMFRMNNAANEYIHPRKVNDWHSIRKIRLESRIRSEMIAKVAVYLASLNYKTLIMVNTKEHANFILRILHEYGFSSVSRCSFGSNVYLRTDYEGKVVDCDESPEVVLEDFKRGDLKIFIGTSHIYEGTDIPNLDVAIISGLGRSLRRIIQGVGRVIRKTKSGIYAYVIDFTDHGDQVLGFHSEKRLEICKKVIGVEDSHIYSGVDFDQFKDIFSSLEEI